MPVRRTRLFFVFFCLLLSLSGCFRPPFNNFRKDPPAVKIPAEGLALGAVAGAVAGPTVIGLGIGGMAGTLLGMHHESRTEIIKRLQSQDIQFVQYGDTKLLIVPTDHYYQFNSPALNEICYEGLNNIIRLLRYYPCNKVYVAGFTDNVGSRKHKQKLSQARAETMLTFLWANNISAKHLKAEGFGSHFGIGDNHWIRGSAYNRRIEIQWFDEPNTPLMPLMGNMK